MTALTKETKDLVDKAFNTLSTVEKLLSLAPIDTIFHRRPQEFFEPKDLNAIKVSQSLYERFDKPSGYGHKFSGLNFRYFIDLTSLTIPVINKGLNPRNAAKVIVNLAVKEASRKFPSRRPNDTI